MSFLSKLFSSQNNAAAQAEAARIAELEAQNAQLQTDLADATARVEVAESAEPETVTVSVPMDMVTLTSIRVQVMANTTSVDVASYDEKYAGLTVREFIQQQLQGTDFDANFEHMQSLSINLSNGNNLTLGLDEKLPSTSDVASTCGGACVSSVSATQDSGAGGHYSATFC
jgi:hypothetical protein